MKADKNIEDFTKYIMNEAEVETPSADFLNNVMDSVKLESELSSSKVYKPLISKSAWVIITLVFVALSHFILTGNSQTSTLLSKLDLSFFDKLPSFNLFERIHFSTTFTFTFILFSILVVFQLYVIKNYFNKQDII